MERNSVPYSGFCRELKNVLYPLGSSYFCRHSMAAGTAAPWEEPAGCCTFTCSSTGHEH